MVVAPGAIEIPAAAQHFSIRQVHPNILLEVTHLTPPATTAQGGKGVNGGMLY